MEINIVKLKKYASNCSVLYVEDDEVIRTQTASFLGRFFSDIVLAEDGALGLLEYKNRNFDVVITDINMPNINGIEMIEAIKEINYNQKILVTSAYNDSENLISLINLDVTSFILKPFNNKQFLYTLYEIAKSISSEEEKKRLQNEVILLSKRAQIIVDQTKIGIVILKNNEIDMANRAFLEIGGFNSFDTLKLEMPEIGVLFEKASHCINATTNSNLIEQLEFSDDDEKKVRITRKSKTHEYKVSLTKLEKNDGYILTFSDITAIHDALFQDEHTKLPIRKFLLEKIELLKQKVSELDVITISLKNFKNIAKWYGKTEATSVEIEFATIIKTIVENQMPNSFIGYFGVNQIVIVPNTSETTNLIKALKEISLTNLKLVKKHEKTDIDFHLTTLVKFLKLDANKELYDIEVDLINEFDLM